MSHLERELELNGLQVPYELQIVTLTQQAKQQNTEKPKSTCHHCKKPDHYGNRFRQLKQEKDQAQNNPNCAGHNNNNISGGPANSNSNMKISDNTNAIITPNQNNRKLRPVYPPCETCGKTNHATEKRYFGANAGIRPLP